MTTHRKVECDGCGEEAKGPVPRSWSTFQLDSFMYGLNGHLCLECSTEFKEIVKDFLGDDDE